MNARLVRELAPIAIGSALYLLAAVAWANSWGPAVVLALLTACGVLLAASASARRFLHA